MVADRANAIRRRAPLSGALLGVAGTAMQRNVREQQADARPAIANPLTSLDRYRTVLLGSPIWHVRAPMIMSTFTESLDFTGKTIHPLTTYAMSGLGTTERDYAASCPGATLREGLAVRGEEVAAARQCSARPDRSAHHRHRRPNHQAGSRRPTRLILEGSGRRITSTWGRPARVRAGVRVTGVAVAAVPVEDQQAGVVRQGWSGDFEDEVA
jgi:hypothetical protein